MEMGQRGRRIVTKIILVVLVIVATLTECIVMRKSREYDAADNIAGLERCVKAIFFRRPVLQKDVFVA